jgi:methionyl-tRNA formyltransferase
VRNLVRAVTHPYPGAFTFAGTAKILVWWTEHVRTRDEGDLLGLSLDARRVAPPGTVRRAAGGVFVACGDWMWLRLDRVEIDGREGDATEFADILRDGIQLGGS